VSPEAVALLPRGTLGTVVLRGGSVLDVDAGSWQLADVLVENDRIAAVGTDLDADQVVDCAGKWILPGLIDCHVHLVAATADLGALVNWPASYVAHRAAAVMRDMLARGFTTVRDINGADAGLVRAEREGLIDGPRVFFGGKGLSPTGGHSDVRGPQQYLIDGGPDRPGLGRVADGVDDVRLAARDELRKGADHIKIMASGGIVSPTDRLDSLQYSRAEITAVVEEVGNAKRYVAAHAYTAESILRALDCGVRTIEHGNFVDAECARALIEHEAFLVPTVVTYWHLVADGERLGLTAAQLRKARTVLDAGLAGIEAAQQAGADIAYGTDLLGPMHRFQNQEFEIRARVQQPIDIVRSATTVAARLLRAQDDLGRIAPGLLADLLVLDADPLADIAVLAAGRPAMVLQDGRIVHRSAA
jgi:imidazolonepropionase-like amidohydrolase